MVRSFTVPLLMILKKPRIVLAELIPKPDMVLFLPSNVPVNVPLISGVLEVPQGDILVKTIGVARVIRYRIYLRFSANDERACVTAFSCE